MVAESSLMSDDFAPAIAVFEKIIAEAERKAAEARRSINALYQARGLQPPYADDAAGQRASATSPSPVPMQVRRDTFYGKKQMTAIRELLEMRRAQGEEGPATPREVVNGLKAGGYRFETKSDDIALIGVRALMRKATNVFHKLPGTNAYGLVTWYPNAKTAPAAKPSKPSSRPGKDQLPKRSAAKPKSAARPKRNPATRSGGSAISTFVENALADGAEWTTERLKQEALSKGIDDITPSTSKQKFQGALLALQKRNRVLPLGGGVWRIAPAPETSPSGDPRVVPMKGVA
jgi:hypothetical protein